MANSLIVKKRGQRFRFELRSGTSGSAYKPANCNLEINVYNYKDLALFLSDLRTMWDIPIDKAIEEYKRKKNDGSDNPFW
jgi:hypothetical protein